MSAVLRFTLLVLCASCACGGLWSGPKDRSRGQRSNGHHYNPHARTYNYPTYNHHHPTSKKPQCTAQTPCYEVLLTYTRDVIPDPRPDPDAFIYHYKKAGFDRYAIIEEGKRAAKFFHHQYGVDVGYLPDEAYLAPNVTLPSGMRFTFSTPVPHTSPATINVASQGPAIQLINAGATVVEWKLSFPADYYSNGAFKGHIPAGSGAGFGSYLFDVCPEDSPYNPCRSTLSRARKGRVFIRFKTRTFSTPGVLDCLLTHAEWGQGHIIGAFVTTPADGVAHERAILTFPRSCHSSVKCFARGHNWSSGHPFVGG